MKNYKISLYIFGIICLISSCSPVNLFTRIEKTPRTHTYNYCISELKAPRSILNKKEWIVYSDRAKNFTTMNAGGKIKLKDLEYLEPLLVIGEKKEYLKLIRYNPEIIKNGKLTKRKDAEFYGWIHRSKLLLNNQSITNIKTGLKNKSILAIADTLALKKADVFFQDDSVKTFKNPELYDITNKPSLYDIVYIMKRATERKKVLISRTPYITPENVKSGIIGWINSNLIQTIGQQLFINKTEPIQTNETLNHITKPNSMKYDPVIVKPFTDNKNLRTATLLPIIDRSDNCIFNVNGNTISFEQKLILDKELRKINVMFVIEPGENTIKQMPALINSFQNMKPIFQNTENSYTFRFGLVISNYKDGKLNTDTVNYTDNFNDIISNLVYLTKNNKLSPIPSSLAWHGLKAGIKLISQQEPATNIVIMFGEKGRPNQWPEAQIARQAGKYNCRFMGYQMYSGEENDYNNFVIQYTNLINTTAGLVAKKKREQIVYSNQLREKNAFIETSKNAFYLDFPERSMTQGGICFPEKQQLFSLDQLTTSIDSFLMQIKADNTTLTESIEKAFITVGNSKDKYDQSLLNHFHLEKKDKIELSFKQSFKSTYPLWYKRCNDTTAIDSTYHYQLLLSEKELENMRNIIEAIAEIEVDSKQIDKSKKSRFFKSKKSNSRKICDCPEEDFSTQTSTSQIPDSLLKIKYLSTKKPRKILKLVLLNEIYSCPFCKSKTKIKKLTLADVQELIFQAPTYTHQLQNITIKNLTRRRKLKDPDFEELLNYYKSKKEILDSEINEKISFTSSDETYYWVNTEWLP